MYRLHRVASHYKIDLGCNCPLMSYLLSKSSSNDQSCFRNSLDCEDSNSGHYYSSSTIDHHSLNLLADLALKSDNKLDEMDKTDQKSDLAYSWFIDQYSKLKFKQTNSDVRRYRVLNLLNPYDKKNLLYFQVRQN